MTRDAIATLRDDPDIGPLVAEHGAVSVDPAADLFERMVVSILRQQVSVAAADAIRARLTDAVELTPEAVRRTDRSSLRDLGVSRQKASYLHNVADAFVDRGYSREYFEGMDDEAVIADLTRITGVGAWTAKMQLLFGLGRPDVFPVEDLGVRRGMHVVFGDDLDRSRMTAIADRWRPYRSYATLYLWRAVE